MEHRWSSRVPGAGNVGLYFAPFGWLTGRLHDMSVGGALIEPTGTSLPMNALLTLVFRSNRTGLDEWLRLPAMVVRTAEQNVGVMYLEHDVDIARRLRGTLCEAEADKELHVISPFPAVDVHEHSQAA